MFSPENYLCINENDNIADGVNIEARVEDRHGWTIWGEMSDSFTADDLDAFALMFQAAARNLRDRNSR